MTAPRYVAVEDTADRVPFTHVRVFELRTNGAYREVSTYDKAELARLASAGHAAAEADRRRRRAAERARRAARP